jgi:hypothetical protein
MTTLALRLPRTFPVHKTLIYALQNHFSRTPSFCSSIHLLHRHASTSTSTPRRQPPLPYKSKSPTAATPIPPPDSPINGPSSTHPAPLILPTRLPSQSLPAFYFTTGKTYLAFYKTGVKNIYHNFRASRPIQARINTQYNSSLRAAVAANALTRRDFQLLVRNWHDVKRVPVFALVFAVCGEFTPLVVVFLSSVVPWTCRIPKQVNGDRRKLEERRRVSFRNLTVPPLEGKEGGVKALVRMQLLHVSWSLGLSSSAWDWLGGRLPGLPTFLLRRKVARRVDYLDMDDSLIGVGGGVEKMQDDECRMACVERGIDVLGRKDEDLRRDLEAWLQSRGKFSIEHLLLTRYVSQDCLRKLWEIKLMRTDLQYGQQNQKQRTQNL